MGETGLDKVKTVLRVTSGNFLEMYDFFLFGIYARPIAHTFFPNDDPYASLMATFLSFAAGFAMRPIGALVLGPYIDRIGRRKGLIVTLSIMACGTILIAFVPGYATIGVLAPDAGGGWGGFCRDSRPASSSAASRSICRRWRRPVTRASTSPGNRQASRSRSCSPRSSATRSPTC